MKHVTVTLLIALAVSAVAPMAWAQIVSGSIAGTIVDSSGAVTPGAQLTLTRASTGQVRHTTSDDAGNFLFGGLEPGEYTLVVTKSGFKTIEQRDITLTTGDRLTLTGLVLSVGAISDMVEVVASAATVQTAGADRGDLVDSRQIEDLMVRGRNVTDLVQLVPGVVFDSTAEDIGGSANFYVQGSRNTSNNVSVDGVAMTDMGNGSGYKMVVGQSAVAEVRVLTSNYQAEFGRMAGSNIQIVTKSGAKSFHGDASYFKRHEQFNANNFFDNRQEISPGRYRYNTMTYSVGGPIYIPGRFNRDRDKLFFFWQQEYWPTKNSSSNNVTVPTAAERTGDYSKSVDLNNRTITVKDPFNNAAPFAGNIVPKSRLDSSGIALLNMFPLPNFLDRTISGGRYNYVFVSDNDVPKLAQTLKLDYNVNSNNLLTGTVLYFRQDQTGGHGIGTSSANWPQIRKSWLSHPKSLSTRHTRVISPSLLNEFGFSALSQPAWETATDSELRANQRDTVGFTAGQLFPAANPLNIVPNAAFGSVTGAANLSTEGRFPLYNAYYLVGWSDNLTWTHGSHTLKAGIYAEWFYRHQKKAVTFNGAYTFGTNANNPLESGYAYSNAALGVFNTYRETSGVGWMKVHTQSIETFLQDNWKVSRKLTLDIGARIYWIWPITEQDGQMTGFVPSRYDPSRAMQLIRPVMVGGKRAGLNPVTGQTYPDAAIGAIAPGAGTLYNGTVVNASSPDYPNGMVNASGATLGPRIGFVYRPFSHDPFLVRGGFGMFFDRYRTEIFANSFIAVPPMVSTPVINYGQISTIKNSLGLSYPGSVSAADPSGKLPTVMNFSLSMQRQLRGGVLMDVGYAGSLGRHLDWRRDLNSIPLGSNFLAQNLDPTQPTKPLAGAFLRPIPGYTTILTMEPAGSSNYHSLQVSARRRFAQHFQFGAAWTWSKAMDFNDSDTEQVTTLVPLRIWNYGLASFDRTHVLALNYLVDLPKWPVHNKVARGALNGWQLSGITRFVSGQPQSVDFSTTGGTDFTGTDSISVRIVVLGDPVLPKSERSFSHNFRTDVFSMPAVGTLGNAAKTLIRGPGIDNFDLAMFKNFYLRERLRLQFRVEAYNAFNHTQFSDLDTTARFNSATGQQINSRFSEFTAARTPRRLQLALRLVF